MIRLHRTAASLSPPRLRSRPPLVSLDIDSTSQAPLRPCACQLAGSGLRNGDASAAHAKRTARKEGQADATMSQPHNEHLRSPHEQAAAQHHQQHESAAQRQDRCLKPCHRPASSRYPTAAARTACHQTSSDGDSRTANTPHAGTDICEAPSPRSPSRSVSTDIELLAGREMCEDASLPQPTVSGRSPSWRHATPLRSPVPLRDMKKQLRRMRALQEPTASEVLDMVGRAHQLAATVDASRPSHAMSAPDLAVTEAGSPTYPPEVAMSRSSVGCRHPQNDWQLPAEAPLRFDSSTGQPVVGLADWNERASRDWLRSLRLEVSEAEEAAPLLQNPLRNGTLLRDLARTLRQRAGGVRDRAAGGAPARLPRTLGQARIVVAGALRALGMHAPHCRSSASDELTTQQRRVSSHDGAPDTPSEAGHTLTYEERFHLTVESMLCGSHRTIWGIIGHVRVTTDRERAHGTFQSSRKFDA